MMCFHIHEPADVWVDQVWGAWCSPSLTKRLDGCFSS